MLSMSDKFVKYPLGVVENVPSQVGKFVVPVDSIVWDMAVDVETPLLFGRPF